MSEQMNLKGMPEPAEEQLDTSPPIGNGMGQYGRFLIDKSLWEYRNGKMRIHPLLAMESTTVQIRTLKR